MKTKKNKTYCQGELFTLSGPYTDADDIYMLCQVDPNKMTLIVIKSEEMCDIGNRWGNIVQVKDPWHVTKNEMKNMVNQYTENINFKRVTEAFDFDKMYE